MCGQLGCQLGFNKISHRRTGVYFDRLVRFIVLYVALHGPAGDDIPIGSNREQADLGSCYFQWALPFTRLHRPTVRLPELHEEH